jgi:hypothetical protein
MAAAGRPMSLPYYQRAREKAFTDIEAASPLAKVPYDLRHAAVSTWLAAGVPPKQVALWAGHSVEVLMRVYAKVLSGQEGEAMRRILEATTDTKSNAPTKQPPPPKPSDPAASDEASPDEEDWVEDTPGE